MDFFQFNLPVNIILLTNIDDCEKQLNLNKNLNTNYIILNLKNLKDLKDVLWFRQVRSLISSYGKTLIGAMYPGINLENLKSSSIAVIEPNYLTQKNDIQENSVLNVGNETAAIENKYTTYIHKGHLRSGQSIKHIDGDVLVCGNVHHGAEVLSGGNIIILGELQGRALAGALIKNQAIISAFSLDAEIVSIDGYYLSHDELSIYNRPVSIFLEEETIQIQ